MVYTWNSIGLRPGLCLLVPGCSDTSPGGRFKVLGGRPAQLPCTRFQVPSSRSSLDIIVLSNFWVLLEIGGKCDDSRL